MLLAVCMCRDDVLMHKRVVLLYGILGLRVRNSPPGGEEKVRMIYPIILSLCELETRSLAQCSVDDVRRTYCGAPSQACIPIDLWFARRVVIPRLIHIYFPEEISIKGHWFHPLVYLGALEETLLPSLRHVDRSTCINKSDDGSITSAIGGGGGGGEGRSI